MNNKEWAQPVDAETAKRRAAGRKHYNAWRQFRAEVRRQELAELLATGRFHMLARGDQSRLADKLGVHRSTVCRDIQVLLRRASGQTCCPVCGRYGDMPLRDRNL